MDGKKRIYIVSFLYCIQEKAMGRQEKVGAWGRGSDGNL
jgi:hypothetical protein